MPLFLLIPLFTTGCKVVDAPEALDELVVFGFVNFDEGEEFRQATVTGLLEQIDLNAEQLLEGYRVDPLTDVNLGDAGITPPETANSEVIGMAAFVEIEGDLLPSVDILSSDALDEHFEGTLVYDVHEETDRACFLAQECDGYDIVRGTRITDLSIFGTAEQEFSMSWRWVEVPELDSPVALARSLASEPTDVSSPLLQIDQNYIFTMYYPTDGVTRRFETNWIDYQLIGLDLPDAVALDLAVDAMGRRADELSEILAE